MNDRNIAMQLRDLGFQGGQPLLDRAHVVPHLANIGTNRPQMLKDEVFGFFGHLVHPRVRADLSIL